eukprot:TRINITY_DN14386_c0_g1_i2.p1 TRINITY_DN14386_c0_g1~~TRINITY_DN14386_c0_g1_i2.p1  ORF type:complete len:579 (+),score=192.66 TRINITY_DN14386_c0_g1_i2:231-1967(+)
MATVLNADEYAIIEDNATGERRVEHDSNGKVLWLNELDALMTSPGTKCINLTKETYVVVEEKGGEKRNEIGPQMFVPGPFSQVSATKRCYNLAKNEYLRIKDENGELRIEVGQKRVIPEPLEEVLEELCWVEEGRKRVQKKMSQQTAVNIDEHHCVIVRNTDDGTLVQITEHGLFIPGPYQTVEEVRKKIVLQEFERMAYIDTTGRTIFRHGDVAEERNFFLPPYCEKVVQEWSTDLHKEHTETEQIWRFDVRPTYMQYEFACRTIDNVELIVDVSFYWEITNIEMLIMKTADAPGDICTHARSRIIQSVSNKTLMHFLKDFNEIVREGAGVGSMDPKTRHAKMEACQMELGARERELELVTSKLDAELRKLGMEEDDLNEKDLTDQALIRLKQELATAEKNVALEQSRLAEYDSPVEMNADPFYGERGVNLISVEVLRFKCSNPETDLTLQEIIKETADRLKKKEYQYGENEVALSKIEGDIKQELANEELIRIKKSHLITESKIEGEAEAAKVKAFCDGLPGDHKSKAVELYTMLRKEDVIKSMSESNATMYLTPDDVNLTIGSLYPAHAGSSSRR